MSTATILILLYLASVLICLGFGYFINWSAIHTVGDLLCPLFIDSVESSISNVFCIYVPFINTVVAIVVIISMTMYVIYEFFRRLLTEWTGIGDFVSKIINHKVK